MVPVIDCGLPTATVEPLLGLNVSTVRVPVEASPTTRALEFATAVLVKEPLREMLVLTKALIDDPGLEVEKL